MVKQLNFKLDTHKLINMSDSELLMEVSRYTRQYLREYNIRIKLLRESLKCCGEAYARTNIEQTRLSKRGDHSDITHDKAVRLMDCEILCDEDATIEEVNMIDVLDYPDEIKLLIALKKGLILYNMALILFPDDVREVVELRLKGHTIEQIAEEIDRGETYVNDRFAIVKKEMERKAKELAAYMEFTA